MVRQHPGVLLVVVLLGLGGLSCRRDPPPDQPAQGPSPAPLAPPATPGNAQPEEVQRDESVRPVYPPLAGVPSPLVVRACQALHDVPEKRRADCCKIEPTLVLTSECVRMLGVAVESGAIELAEDDVAACETAQAAQHSDCAHVGPWPLQAAGPCQRLLRGTLTAGARCRSSLECVDGLRCRGVGPTEAGTCATPGATGEPCGGRVDTLATMTRQLGVDAAHPECREACGRRRCEPVRVLGATCELPSQCGRAARCERGRCVAGAAIPAGGACSGAGCAPGTRCIAGTCALPKPLGADCATDMECAAGCVAGRCGPRCDLR